MGKRRGEGLMTWPNGATYKGGWHDDKASGSGIRTTTAGRVDSGLWTNGCFRQGDRWATAGATAEECGFR